MFSTPVRNSVPPTETKELVSVAIRSERPVACLAMELIRV
uniref:Uncharacterized protein n=1 Tax=Podoviridae sp. ctDd04 TaxID=2825232 RepID=A0A8S5U793_9CAUD|nr:MAG TPA: hypothetical protein [Podoviridae sp. ctDd04]